MAGRAVAKLAVLLLHLAATTYGQRNPGLGLSPNNLQKNGIHIGTFLFFVFSSATPFYFDARADSGTTINKQAFCQHGK
jgi:hypothetical protein